MSSEIDKYTITDPEAVIDQHIAGFSMREISVRIGSTPARVRKVIGDYYENLNSSERAQKAALEGARLNALQSRYWNSAMAGNVKDAELVLKIIDRRIKIDQLDKPVDQGAVSRLVLVAGTTKEDFMEALRLAQSEEQSSEFGRAEADIVEGELIEEDE